MDTVTRFFNHAQEKLQQVLEHELPNIQTAADFVTESCNRVENSMYLAPVILI